MLAAVITEARAALVGDREDSTANRMTQPNCFGAPEHQSCDDREAQSPGLRCRQHAASAPLTPAR
jgi:hypothetical protein